jgi:flagellar biosynthesis chaperone FliJ
VAMIRERLELLVTMNGQGALREMDRFGQAAEKNLPKAEQGLDRVGTKMTATGIAMMGAGAVATTALWGLGRGAAEAEQAVGGTEAVFKDSADAMQDWAEGADVAAGLSDKAAMALGTRLGGALQQLGYGIDESVAKSQELVQLGADLSATYGGTTQEAVEGIGAAFRGEFDTLERWNIFLKQSNVDAKAVSMGLAENTTEVSQNARAQATLALILEGSRDAQGQFARELNTTSGQLAVTAAEAEDAGDALGSGFTTMMSKAAAVAGIGATAIISADEATGGLASTVIAFTAVGLLGAGAVSTLIGQVISMRTNIGSAITTVRTWAAAHTAAAAAIGVTALAVTAAVGVWQYYKSVQEDAQKPIKEGVARSQAAMFNDNLSQLHARFLRVRAEQEKLAASMNPIERDAANVLGEHGDRMETILKLAGSLKVLTGDSIDATNAWLLSEAEAGRWYENIDDAVAAYTRQLDLNKQSSTGAAQAQESIAAAAEKAAEVQKKVAAAAKEAADAQLSGTRDVFDAQRSLEDSHRGVESAQRRLSDVQREGASLSRQERSADLALVDAKQALLDVQERIAGLPRERERAELDVEDARLSVTEAEERLRETMRDGTKDATDRRRAEMELARARLRVGDAEEALIDVQQEGAQAGNDLARAQLAVEEAQAGVDNARRASVEHTRNVRDAEREVEDAMYRVSQASFDLMLAQQMLANGGHLPAKDQAMLQAAELQTLADRLAPGSPLRAQLQGFIDQLNTMPTEKEVEIKIRADQAAQTLYGLESADQVPGEIYLGPVPDEWGYRVPKQGQAVGGVLREGDTLLHANEVVRKRGSRVDVMTAAQATPLRGGAGGGFQINGGLHLHGGSPERNVAALARLGRKRSHLARVR